MGTERATVRWCTYQTSEQRYPTGRENADRQGVECRVVEQAIRGQRSNVPTAVASGMYTAHHGSYTTQPASALVRSSSPLMSCPAFSPSTKGRAATSPLARGWNYRVSGQVTVGDRPFLTVVGDFTLSGVTLPVEFAVEVAVDSTERIEVSGIAIVLRSDLGLIVPDVPSVSDVAGSLPEHRRQPEQNRPSRR